MRIVACRVEREENVVQSEARKGGNQEFHNTQVGASLSQHPCCVFRKVGENQLRSGAAD